MLRVVRNGSSAAIQSATNVDMAHLNLIIGIVELVLLLVASFFIYRWIVRTQIISQLPPDMVKELPDSKYSTKHEI